MNLRNRAAQRLLIALLVASLNLSGSAPALLNATAIAAEPAEPVAPSTTTCCCGTSEGSCCSQACCGMAPPKGDSQPRPATAPRSVLPDPLASGDAAGGFGALHRSPLLPNDFEWGRGLPDVRTLQAEQVRLQI